MELEIDCGFDTHDETINFGSRRVADDKPYESITFASLTKKTNDSSFPVINSKLNGDQLFCSVNNIFVVFQDAEFGTLKFSCTLNHIIDDFSYCSSAKLLFIFLRDGSLQIFKDVAGSFLFSKNIRMLEEDSYNEKLFINSYFLDSKGDMISLLSVTSIGQIFRLDILGVHNLELSTSPELIHTIDGRIELSAFYNSMLFLHGSKMWILDLLNNNIVSSNALDITFATFSGTMILSLLGSGQLTYICPITLQHYLRDIDHPIESITVINNGRGNIKFINATSMKDSSGNVHLYSFNSDFSIIYTLTLDNDVILINAETEVDEARYISLIKKNDEFIELRFQCVIATDPQKRLNRLLRRNKFDEAEQFARSQNLDVNIVSREKAKIIAENWKVTTEDIDTLIKIFHTLEDHSFILDCCLTVENTCEQTEDLQRILNYACNLQVSEKDEIAKEKQYHCNRLLIRFKLFCLIGETDMDHWNSFSDDTLIREVKQLFKEQKMFEAITVYGHLAPAEIEHLDESCIKEMLDILNGIDPYVIGPILPRFISLTLDWLPSSLPFFIDWMEMKIFNLEKDHDGDFPENAIEFLQINMQCLKLKESPQALQKGDLNNRIPNLFKVLHKLDILKSQYGVTIPINVMMQKPEIVVQSLLDLTNLTTDVYNSILQEFIYKYILENDLNPDQLFYDALINILKYQESWSNIIGSILSCITSQDLKLQAVENMLTMAPLPWSESVKHIGVQVLKECYPKSGNVQQLMSDEPRLMVMSRLEYGFDVNNAPGIDDLQFLVKRIIRCNLSTMISDAFVLCEDKIDCKIETMRLLLHHFIHKGDFNNAFKLLEQDEIVVKKGLETILFDLGHMSEFLSNSEAENYAHMLNSTTLMKKYDSLCENEFDSYRWKQISEAFLGAMKISTHFNVNVKSTDLSQHENRKNLIYQTRTKIMNEYESGEKSMSEVFELLKLLSSDMGIKPEKLFSRCWTEVKVNKTEFLCRVAEEFLSNAVEVKYICIFVVYLLRNLIQEDEHLVFEESFVDSYSTNDCDKFSGKFLELASLLTSKAICNAETEQLVACLKIASWVDSIHFLNRYKNQDKKFGIPEGNLHKSVPSYACRFAIQKLFTLFASFIAQFKNINYKYLTYYNKNEETMTQKSLLQQIENFETYLQVLNQEGESLLAYKLMITLLNNLSSHKNLDHHINKTLNNLIKKHLIPNLVQQSQLVRDIDKNLLHTSLMWCNAEETEKFIVHILQHNRKVTSKVRTISSIAVKMFDFHKDLELSVYFKQVLLNVAWWEKVKDLNINYDLFFRVNSEERLKLMIQSKDLDFELIKEYCRDNKLADIQSFYLFYLKTYLLNWKPKYEIDNSNIGRRKLIMKANQQKDLCRKCSNIMNHIENREKVEKMLQEIWRQVNFYYYEVFSCILDLYRENSFKHLKLMLQFLETYERISEPSNMEVEKWFNTFPDCQVIEPLSEFRIIFNNNLLESKDIWNIICKEISLENYTKWFEAVQTFSSLNVDNICSFLVKNLVAEGILQVIKPGDWVIAKHTHLFNEIDNCLDYMKDDVKKITSAYILLTNTPEGADQVTIAEIAYKYAEEYKMKTADLSQVSLAKIEKKYRKCLCLQILNVHDLAEQKYIDLILDIEKLLLALYHDERIIQKMNNFCHYCPDINTAVEKLADLFDFDVTEFKKNIVENYLMDTSIMGVDITTAYSKKMNSNHRTEYERSQNDLKRVVYICSNDILYWHGFLWNDGYKSNESDLYKARCVKCLLLLLPDETSVSALCSQSYESIKNISDELTLSSILNKFGLQIKLHDMDTRRLVTKKLALIGSQESVLAMAHVCKILKIKKLKYWKYIIGNMDRYKMYWDMIEFLEYTKTEDYIYEKFYIDAWTNLIDFSVNDIISSCETEIEDRVSNDLTIMQQCPVIFLLNLEGIVKKCIEMKRQRVADVLLQYVPKNS